MEPELSCLTEQISGVCVSREEKDFAIRAMSLNLNRKIDPGELRHGNIAYQEIGRARPDVFQSFQGVGKKASRSYPVFLRAPHNFITTGRMDSQRDLH